MYESYWFDLVTPQRALIEWGIPCPNPSKAVEILNRILPPDVPAAYRGIYREDFRIAALKAGIAIQRADFDQIFEAGAERLARNMRRRAA